jgi:aflatoxin B1 aldehyde reductase
MSGLKVAFGGAGIGPERAFSDEKTVNALLDVLEKKGCKIIDSAQLYAGSEQLLGEVNAGARFTIDTKWFGGFAPGMLATKVIVDSTKTSLETLKMEKGREEHPNTERMY